MRSLLLSLLALALLPSAFAQKPAEKRGPSTPEERARALTFIDDLEKNPFGSNAKAERQWLTIWLIEVPDIHVQVCTLLPDMPKGDKKDSNILFVQMMFGGAKYAIEHKDDPVNELAQFQAGVPSALRLYEVLLAQNPKDRQPKLDDLVARMHAGTLDSYIAEQVPKTCTASTKAS